MTKLMDKRKRRKEQAKIDQGLKNLRIKQTYDAAIEHFIKTHKASYKDTEHIKVPLDWVKQFVIDFLIYNDQEGKDRKTLQGASLGAVLFEHSASAQLFLDAAGYKADIVDNQVVVKKKKPQKKNAKKKGSK